MLLPPGLTAIETAVGIPFGGQPAPPGAPRGGRDVFEALVTRFAGQTSKGPCVVWVSGDDGAAVVLAAAVQAARRAGAPMPVAVSPHHDGVADDPYAEAVVRALGVDDWRRPDVTGQLGLLGEIAKDSLRRHGLRFPSLAYLFVPLLREARGGTLFSGHALVEGWALWRGAGLARAARQRRMRPHEVRELRALAPLPVRRRLAVDIARGMDVPYLRRAPRAEATHLAVDDLVRAPLFADAAVRASAARVCVATALTIYDRLARDHQAEFVFAFVDRSVVEAIATQFGPLGCSGPDEWRRRVAPQLPPRATRYVAPTYAQVWQDEATRAFIESWDGSGLDDELVDPDAVREAWRRGDWRSGMLLQSAWLHADQGGETT